MKSYCTLILLLTCVCYSVMSEVRDPFQPGSFTLCFPPDGDQVTWRLQGILGNSSGWQAWIQLAEGQWSLLKEKSRTPDGLWQVQQIGEEGIWLQRTDEVECPESMNERYWILPVGESRHAKR